MRALRFARGLGKFGAVAFVAALATACVATESPVAPRGIAVSTPPPAPQVEAQRSPAPSAGSVWIEGYWHWTGMQYAWIPGHWETAQPGRAWAAPQYTASGGSYFYEAGSWKPVSAGSANALR
jgi:hypothetical protein